MGRAGCFRILPPGLSVPLLPASSHGHPCVSVSQPPFLIKTPISVELGPVCDPISPTLPLGRPRLQTWSRSEAQAGLNMSIWRRQTEPVAIDDRKLEGDVDTDDRSVLRREMVDMVYL